MINLRHDTSDQMKDNDRYDDLDYTTGLREFQPPKRKTVSWQVIAVLSGLYLLGSAVVLLLFSVWKTVYCWSDHYGECHAIERAEPIGMLLFLFSGPFLMLVYGIIAAYIYLLRERAVARRIGMVLDRYGDNIPTALLERQGVTYYERRYMVATALEREIAPYKIYKGVNTLSSVRNSDSNDIPLLEDNSIEPNEWKNAIDEAPHVLIYGPSKAGKSTLAQAIVAMMRAEYIVIDPLPNKPGERKWGGIDFVTLQKGDNEYGIIRKALNAIKDEDKRRRQTMDTQVFRPLVIIIDEVLALVAALKQGKDNVMSDFIASMGYSARHRNIKIILIGQGKNLIDLGLESGTARNNYALVRASRNAATNERGAFIITDEGEVPINVREVLSLSLSVAGNGKVWLTHNKAAEYDDSSMTLLNELLTVESRDKKARDLFKMGLSIKTVGSSIRTSGYRISTEELQALRKEALE